MADKTTNKTKQTSISTKLIWTVAVLMAVGIASAIAIDLFGFPLVNIQGQIREKRQDTIAQLDENSKLLKYRVARWFEERRGDISLTSSSISFARRTKTAIEAIDPAIYEQENAAELVPEITKDIQRAFVAYFRRIMRAYNIYDAIYIIDPATGRIVITTRPEDFGKQVIKRRLIDNAILVQTPFIYYTSGPDDSYHTIAGDTGGSKLLAVNAVLRLENQTAGVLIFEMRMISFVNEIRRDLKALGRSGEAIFVDKEGRFLTPAEFKPVEDHAQSFRETVANYVSKGVETITELTDYRGEPVYASFRYLWLNQMQGVALITKIDKDEITAVLEDRLRVSLLFSAVLIALSVWLIALAIRRQLKPVKELTATVERIAAGDMNARTNEASADEVGRLATSFNNMIDRLAERDEEIRRSEEFLYTLLDTSPISISISSMEDGRFLRVNKAVAEMMQLSQDELLKRKSTELYSNPGDRAELLQQLEEMGRIDNFDVSGLRIGTGEKFWLCISATPIDYEDQKAILSVGTDITERKEAEEALREARDVAEEATRAKDMFLAAMSHEIRTPMNGVVGMIELLQGTALADDQRRMLESAKDSSFALLTIINDILDFSKIEAGKMEIEEVAFDLRKAADAVGDMLGLSAVEKNLPLVVHVQPEVPSLLLGDQVRIRQILFNLAGNAVKFTEHGEVRIGIKVAKTYKDGSVDILYEVRDRGIGMTEEQTSRLFKPFEQAEASTTRKYGGTGLGLSIVARLVELMGGKVEVESKPGKGSTFRVTLRHSVPKSKAGEAAGVDLGCIKMLALTPAGSRLDLLSQIVEGEEGSLLHRLASETTRKDFLAALKEAEAGHDPFGVVYLSVDVGTAEQDQLRRLAASGKELKSIPRFLVERHNTPITQDIRGSVLIAPTPYTESNLVRALSILLGKASPDIVSRAEVEGRAAEVPTIEEAEAAGTLVLVAEDNKTNQDVIGRQLAVFGYAHEIADDGEIALRMLSKRTYGLLLCDVHMPNMDGYQLTRTIREKEKKSGSRLPIIAVTANALQGEGDRCLAAGMDAYMAKPVRMKELQACLEKWLPKEAEEALSAAASKAASSANEDADDVVVDPGVLVDMFGDDEKTLKEILSEFPPAAWEVVVETEGAFEAKDWAGVGDAGHKLKGAARTIGANRLADICEALEKAGKAGDDKTINKLMPRLRPAMEAVEVYVRGRADAAP